MSPAIGALKQIDIGIKHIISPIIESDHNCTYIIRVHGAILFRENKGVSAGTTRLTRQSKET